MRPRYEPLTIPESPRYFVVELAKGRHHLRLPDFTAIELIGEYSRRDDAGRRAHQAMLSGLAVGLCWYHRAQELETPAPVGREVADLEEYSRAVQSELMEAGYRVTDLLALGTAAMLHITRLRREEEQEIREVLGNGGAESDSASSS